MSVQEWDRLYVITIWLIYVSLCTKAVSCDHVSSINLSSAHFAVNSSDLYSPMLPSHSCRRLKIFGHQKGLATLQVASCCYMWQQGLDEISQTLELSPLKHGM